MAEHAIVRINRNVVRRARADEVPASAPTTAPARRHSPAVRSAKELIRQVFGEPQVAPMHGGHVPRRHGAGI